MGYFYGFRTAIGAILREDELVSFFPSMGVLKRSILSWFRERKAAGKASETSRPDTALANMRFSGGTLFVMDIYRSPRKDLYDYWRQPPRVGWTRRQE